MALRQINWDRRTSNQRPRLGSLGRCLCSAIDGPVIPSWPGRETQAGLSSAYGSGSNLRMR